MKSAPIIARLWDYGWLCHDIVSLPASVSDSTLIEHYISSPAFHNSFLPSDKDESGVHGPFVAARIHADDFIPLEQAGVEEYLKSVEVSYTPGEDFAAHGQILPHLRSAFERNLKCYVLRRDERDKDFFHDWGFVLCVFREFLFAGQSRNSLERFIIGYD